MKLLCASVRECVCLKVYAYVHACMCVWIKWFCVDKGVLCAVYVVKSANECARVHVLLNINIHKNALVQGCVYA